MQKNVKSLGRLELL